MDIYAFTDNVILEQIGLKLKQERLAQNVSQSRLSKNSGLTQSSISMIEKGKNGSMKSIIMLLRSLNKLDVLNCLFEEEKISPIEYSKLMKKQKRRKNASPNNNKEENITDFNWDD